MNTEAIHKAIEKCAADGGGTVIIPRGLWITGPITMKSNINPPNYIKGNPDMFLNKHNILNVAISRARDYLFVLMPDDKTENVKKLQKINQIADLCFVYGGQNFAQFSSITIESKLFGSPSYIYDNSFATTHQKVNVYSKPVKKYELRCEEKAVDVQIKDA
jgi:hypothetical protein